MIAGERDYEGRGGGLGGENMEVKKGEVIEGEGLGTPQDFLRLRRRLLVSLVLPSFILFIIIINFVLIAVFTINFVPKI